MNKTLSASEQLTYATVRIECTYANGTTGTGTGFFVRFLDEPNGSHVPVVVTNKHVIRGAIRGKLILTTADEHKNPVDSKHFELALNDCEKLWRMHPSDEVDLCALPIAEAHVQAHAQGVNLFYITLPKDVFASNEQIEDMEALEEIVMVGYPNGIWDSANNKPIFRRGITATHPKLDYCGKKEFMIDAACFPGSSGSPVFIFNDGSFKTKSIPLSSGTRVIFLGVLYAGPQHTATGEVRVIDVPTVQRPVSIATIPNNLGIVIKAERVAELEELFRE